MSIEFCVNQDCGCVITRIEGMVTEPQVIGYLDRLRRAPGYSPALPRLVDVRHVDEMLRPSEIRGLAELVRAMPDIHGGKRALVAGSDLVYGMLRMFELLTNQGASGYRAFRGMGEAAEWLGVDCPAVRELVEDSQPATHVG